MKVTDVDLVLEKTSVGRRAGQRSTARTLVLRGAMLVGVANPELISIGDIVKHPPRPKEVMRGIRQGLRDGAEAGRFGSCDRGRVHNVLLVQNVFIESQQKAGVL